jgi:hypothetical protein
MVRRKIVEGVSMNHHADDEIAERERKGNPHALRFWAVADRFSTIGLQAGIKCCSYRSEYESPRLSEIRKQDRLPFFQSWQS